MDAAQLYALAQRYGWTIEQAATLRACVALLLLADH